VFPGVSSANADVKLPAAARILHTSRFPENSFTNSNRHSSTCQQIQVFYVVYELHISINNTIKQAASFMYTSIAAGCATTQPASEQHRLSMHVIGKHLCYMSCKQFTFDCTVTPVPMPWICHMGCLNVQDRYTEDKGRFADRDGDRSRHTGE